MDHSWPAEVMRSKYYLQGELTEATSTREWAMGTTAQSLEKFKGK